MTRARALIVATTLVAGRAPGAEPPLPVRYDLSIDIPVAATAVASAVALAGPHLLRLRHRHLRGHHLHDARLPGGAARARRRLAAATGVGYLRMAAGHHYLTDVFAGAVAGGLVGFAVPWFFHGFRGGAPQPGDLLPAPGGIAIAW